MAELSLKERACRRVSGMKGARQPYERTWEEIAQHAAPLRARWLRSGSSKPNLTSKATYTSHAIKAARTLTGGMTSGLSSPSRPWFRLAPYDPDLADDQQVKEYLAEVEKRMYAFLAGTNFYAAVKTGYGQLGLFGTEACFMEEHWREGAVSHTMEVGEFWVALSDANVPDTLARKVPMTVSQAISRFGSRVAQYVRNMYDQSSYNEVVCAMHLIEPNTEQQAGRMDAVGKPWRSIWWDENDGRKDWLLDEKGLNEQAFWAPRWDAVSSDPYGLSPGMDALPDLRELQMQVLNKHKVSKQIRNPEKVVPPTVKLTGEPGRSVSASGVDAGKVLVPYVPPPQALQQIREDIVELRQAVDEMFYADLFMAITNMQGIQPRNIEEIASRNEEKLTQLGPVIERVNNEKLEVAIDRAFGIMQRGGLLPDPPEQLQGKPIKVDFVSILAQMQRMVGIGQIERTAGFIGNIAGAVPEALDKLDVDEMIDEYADRAGAPPKIIRSADAVKAIREDRARQAQAAQMAQSAPAVKDAATAAELLSRTRTDPGTALSALTGGA